MSRRTRPLTGDALDLLPEHCRSCVFWECGERDSGAADTPGRIRKQAWVTDRELRDGPPGTLLLVDGRLAGYALHAPSRAFPRRGAPFPTPSEDAVLLATLHVARSQRGGGLGSLLLQAVVRDAIEVGMAAVEAYGDRAAEPDRCILGAEWLLHEGFEIAVEHPRYPLLRLEVRRTARWAETIARAARDLLGRVPEPVPEPVRAVGGRLPVTSAGRPHRSTTA